MKRNSGAARGSTNDVVMEAVECFICVEPCHAVCVFQCGHFTCYACGLRIHHINKAACPACRVRGADPIITRQVSQSAEIYSPEEVSQLLQRSVHNKALNCFFDGRDLASEVAKLNEFLCPIRQCWVMSRQEPFINRTFLEKHLLYDHELSYCAICLSNRPVFLCEQMLYSKTALQQHLDGKCADDNPSFTGHPRCKFCRSHNRFYDGEALLKHMQTSHYTCDICNRGQFIFTFYDNRDSLIHHYQLKHKLCDHPDCSMLDAMARVFANDIELAVHKQRVHGIKPKMLFAPGATDTRSTQSVGGGAAALHGDTPATASNANVIYITFDHVTWQETVNVMPTRAEHEAADRARRQRHARTRHKNATAAEQPTAAEDEHMTVYVPQSNGLPEHYHQAGVLAVMMRPCERSRDAGRSAATPNEVHAFGILSAPAPSGSNGRTGAATSLDSSTTALYFPATNSKAQGPLRERLSALIARELRSPVALADMHDCTRAYHTSRINTSEYYDHLARLFSRQEVFKEVYQLLVATIDSEPKRTAMQELWKIKMAPETQHMERVREEEERRLLEAQKASADDKGVKAKSKNAWFAQNVARPAGEQAKVQGAWGGSHGAGSSAQPGSVVVATAHPSSYVSYSNPNAALVVTDERFPSLPQNTIRNTFGTRKAPKKANAWGRR